MVLPSLTRFRPQLVLISGGFDAQARRDPLASMELSARGYQWMCAALAQVADATAGGRIAMVFEGGYNLTAIEESVAASVRGMTHPRGAEPGGPAAVAVAGHFREAVAKAAAEHAERDSSS